MLFSWKGGIWLVDEDISRRTIAVSIKASKLTARGLAYVLGAIARKIGKHHRAKQTPHGRQTVRQLMGHGAATNSIEVEAPALFDRVARKWNVDYAFYQVAPDKHLLFFKAGQADAITACFSEYSKRLLKRTKSTKHRSGSSSKRPPLNWPASRPARKNAQRRRCMRTDSVKKYVIPNIPYLFILAGPV